MESTGINSSLLHVVEWTAAGTALLSSWAIGSPHRHHRLIGFYGFIAANVMWVAWGSATHAWGLVTMQALFCITSLRGVLNNRAG